MGMKDLEERGHALIAARRPAYAAICRLREDASTRGMAALAIVYGWSALRLGQEAVDEAAMENKR